MWVLIFSYSFIRGGATIYASSSEGSSASASALKEEEAKWYRPFSSFGKSPIARAFRKRSALTSFTR